MEILRFTVQFSAACSEEKAGQNACLCPQSGWQLEVKTGEDWKSQRQLNCGDSMGEQG